MVQWVRLHASSARGAGLIPGQGTKILRALWCIQKESEMIEIVTEFRFHGNHVTLGNQCYAFAVVIHILGSRFA